MKYSTISIIGAGAVGTTTAYALILKNIAAEILLVDINEVRCAGEVLDLSDALPFSDAVHIRKATLREASQSDLIIITAGARQEAGQSRLDLLKTNRAVMRDIIEGLRGAQSEAIIIMVTNPVDLLTLQVQQSNLLPCNRIFGTGTFLDTQRLRGFLSQVVGIAEESIDAYILGEHGNTQFPAWSSARIGEAPLSSFSQLTPHVLEQIAHKTLNKAADIIACKDATYFGIAACISSLAAAVLLDQKKVFPVAAYVEEFNTVLSVPVTIGAQGIEQYIPLNLDAREQELLRASVTALKKAAQQ